MPTYKEGNIVKVTAPKEFADKVRTEQDQYIIDAELAKMKFNLTQRENKQMFEQWNQIKQESEQRLRRIEQISQIQRRNKEQAGVGRQQQKRIIIQPITNITEPNSSDPSIVMRNLEFMRKVINGSG